MSSILKKSYVKDGGTANPPDNITQYADSDFVGWNTDEWKSVYRDLDVETVYKLKSFIVTFVYDGKTLGVASRTIHTQIVQYGKSAFTPSMPEVEGHTFRWDYSAVITSNTDIHGDYYRDGQMLEVVFLKQVSGYTDVNPILKTYVKCGGFASPPTDEQISNTLPSADSNYIFCGWSRPFDNVITDSSTYTVYEPKQAEPSCLILTCSTSKKSDSIKTFQFEYQKSMNPLTVCRIGSSSIAKDPFSQPFDVLNDRSVKYYVQTAVDYTGKITELRKHCFRDGRCGRIQYASFNTVSSIGSYAFEGCQFLTKANFPDAVELKGYAFSGCTQLKDVNMPNIEKVGDSAFSGCKYMPKIDFKKLKTVGRRSFSNNKTATEINLPQVTNIKAQAFYCDENVSSIYMPSLSSIDGGNAIGCENLEEINISSIQYIYRYGIYSVSSPKVTELKMPNKNLIVDQCGLYAFRNSLSSLTLNKALSANFYKDNLPKLWGIGTTSGERVTNANGKTISINWVD